MNDQLIEPKQPENPLTAQSMLTKNYGLHRNPFCPGCGYGIITNCINRVVMDRGDIPSYPFIQGVGCGILTATTLVGYSFYCLHGRALPFATGLKLANPKLKPIVLMGDGDCLSIGMGHFMHAARRNVDMVAILLNNKTYGMTGGQCAPSTDLGAISSTTPYGMSDRAFDGVEVALTAGATYVARWTVDQPFKFMKSFEKALDHKGFSLIELISPCVTYYGRPNGQPESLDMLREIKKNTVSLQKADEQDREELKGKYIVGEFLHRTDIPELAQQDRELKERISRSLHNT